MRETDSLAGDSLEIIRSEGERMDVSDRVVIVEAVEQDADTLAEISKRAFDTDIEVGAPEPGPGGPPGYDASEYYRKILAYLECHTIRLEDEIVGGVMVGSAGEEHRVLERVFVDPDRHKRGIATRAMTLIWERYPAAKLWTVGTPEWNVRTKQFYEKLGFVQVGWDLGNPKWRERWYQKVIDASYTFLKVADLMDGMRNVTVQGVIQEKSYARAVRSRRRRGETLSVANTGFADETGRVVLTLWNEQIKHVSVGDRIRVENGYVGSYQGITQLTVGRSGRLIKLIQ
jgi:GNAT superfamily N-acetyltransferase